MSALIHESPEDSFLIWHDLEAERHAILKALPEAVDIYGSMELEERERRVTALRTEKSGCLPLRRACRDLGATFKGTATGLFFWG